MLKEGADMFFIQQILALFLTMTMELNLTACGEGATQPNSEISEPPAQVQEIPEPVPVSSSDLKVTEGTETYRDFRMDNVLHTPEGGIHYHIYVPGRL